MHKVSITRTTNDLKADLTHALDLIGGMKNYIGHNDVVMLKPNINGTEAITSIELTAALIELLLDYGVKKVVVAESSFGDEKMTQLYFAKSGYSAMCEKYVIELINLNASEIVKAKVARPMINETVDIAKDVFEADKIINMPVMKVHYATGVSLAMKNLKGVLVKEQKRKFHDVGLDESIVDLNNVIKPALNIIDATTCMEKMGPHGGEPLKLDLLIAGEDIAAVDYVGCGIMGYTLDEAKHIKYFMEQSNFDIGDIEVVGEKIEDVKRAFEKVDVKNTIPESFLINQKDACCTCMNALLLSLRFLEENQKNMDVEICLGSNISDVSGTKKHTIAFGKCRKDQQNCDAHIKGCPPYPFHLKKALETLCE